jgi:CPA2 family monovalent cation:H+ antiporter-2
MRLRENIGVNIAMIKRGEHHTILAPSRFERIYPDDKLWVIGTDDQLEQLKRYIEPTTDSTEDGARDVVLKKLTIIEQSQLTGKSIRESGIREQTNGLIVGIERKGRRLLNPESTMVFELSDKVWIVGDEELINNFQHQYNN